MKRLLSPQCFLVAGTFLLALASPARAVLLWSASFDGFADGATITTNNTTGANNTFSGLITSGGGWADPAATLTAQAAETPFASGPYAQALATAGTGQGNLTVRRAGLGTFGSGDVRVFSMDMAKSADSNIGFNFQFVNSSFNNLGGIGSIANANIPTDSLLRITAIYNQSGSEILLPGTLGSLASGGGILYYRNAAGDYTLVGSNASMATSGAGFQFQWTNVTLGEAGLFDNAGFWSSASDDVNGVNVLELAPGSPVPEPGTVALAVVALGLVVAAKKVGKWGKSKI